MDPAVAFVLQGQPPFQPDAFGRLLGFWARAGGTFFGTLIVGGLLLALAPAFTERVIETVEENAGVSFLWGLGIFVAILVTVVVLVITLIGIIVAIPLMIVAAILYLIGSAIVFVAIGERLLEAADVETSRWGHLLVGAFIATVVAAMPIIGGLANFAINAVGVGAMAYYWRR